MLPDNDEAWKNKFRALYAYMLDLEG
jgi:hypothetical protein